MKILIVTSGYFPSKKYGGPPVSINNFCNLMNDKFEIFILTSNHEFGERKKLDNILDGWQKVGNANVLYLSEKKKNFINYENIIKKINPDWIYLNSFFNAKNVLPFLKIGKKYNIKVLLAPRGELCSGALRKKYKKIPYILYLKIFKKLNNVFFQSTSVEETNAISKLLDIKDEKIFLVDNIPSIPDRKIKHILKKKNELKIVFLSRIHPKKNLLNAIKIVNELEGNIRFDIYGPIENEDYWNECLKEIESSKNNIKYCGLVPYENVHSTFSNYHVFLFPTLSENYGHVIIESLSVGTPVVISDQTPWNDVNNYNAGIALSLDNYQLFINYLKDMVNTSGYEYQNISYNAKKFAAMKSDLDEIKKGYLNIFNIK